MVTFTPGSQRFVRAAATGARNGHTVPNLSEAAPDMAASLMPDPFPSFTDVGAVAGGVANIANPLWLAHDFLMPMIIAGIAGAAGLAGKGMRLVGAEGIGNKLKNFSQAVPEGFQSKYVAKPLRESRFGNALAGVANGLASPVYKLSSAIEGRTGWFSGFAGKAAQKSEMHAAKASSMLAGLAHLPDKLILALETAFSVPAGDHQAFTEARHAATEVMGTLGGVAKADKKAVKALLAAGEKAHISAQKAQGWNALATGQHNTLEGVKNASVMQGVSGGLLSIVSAASVVGTAAETISDVKMFRQLVADMTGKDEQEVNTGDALFANLPYAAERARGALLSSAAPRAVLEAINTVFNIKMIKGSHIGMLTFMAPFMASQAIGLLTSGNILDVYKQMKQNEAAGQENLPDQYAALIGMAHKDLAQRQHKGSSFAQELGRIYAERHATVREVLQAVASGQIDKELKEVSAYNDHAATEKKHPSPVISGVASIAPNAAHAHHREKHAHEKHTDSHQPASFADRIAAEASQPAARHT